MKSRFPLRLRACSALEMRPGARDNVQEYQSTKERNSNETEISDLAKNRRSRHLNCN